MHKTRLYTFAVAWLAAGVLLGASATRAEEPAKATSDQEKSLIEVLRSDAPKSEKAITCKKLAIHGSSAAVPDLAKLLPDPELSSWARIALEAIPGPAADEALREAAKSLDGLLLVGTINSIGVRRDAKAVESLTTRLQDKDEAVACAAAVALGHIGDEGATKSLRAALAAAPAKVRSAIAEGCVLSAEQLLAAGKAEQAVALYDEVRKAEVPQQRILEATRGAILARGPAGIPMLVELLDSDDRGLFRLALGTAREFPGAEIDKALARKIGNAKPERAALIIVAMADRPKTIELPAVLKVAGDGPKPVRLAAINAIGRVGDASCVTTLLDAALDSDAELSQAGKSALAALASDKVDAQIVALLSKTDGKAYPLLVELIGQRRIDAVPELLKALDNADQGIRRAALLALGETVPLSQLSVLVSQVVAAKNPEDAQIAQQALKAASVRMPDREACAEALSIAMGSSPATTKNTLLEILAEVGGTKALQTLATAAKSTDPDMQDTASRVLGKWNSVDASSVLLDLAKTAPEAKYQMRALRGYIGLARKFAMDEADRVAICKNAFELATQPDEKKLVIEVLKLHPSTDGLKFAIQAAQVPEVKDEAMNATLVISQKVGAKGVDVSELLSKVGLAKVKLEIVKAEYGAGATQKDVTEIVRKHAKDSPLVSLPNSSFNVAFGGDPISGSVKQLKIKYVMNDKPGEATFAEDALIVLPQPK